jgi:hypothetical protein
MSSRGFRTVPGKLLVATDVAEVVAVVLPITRRAQVAPPSVETPTARPATTSGSVDIATTFEGLVGLTAIASSASLPGIAVTLKFEGGAAAASVAVANATANPRTSTEDVDARNRPLILPPSPRIEIGDPSSVAEM